MRERKIYSNRVGGKESVSLRLSQCASGAFEEKAKAKCSYSNPHPKKQCEFEFECEDMLLLHTQKKRVSLSMSVRIFCSFTLKPALTLASVPRTGIEPALPCDNQILSLARLPVPPSGLGGAKISKSRGLNKQKRVFC